MKYTFILEKITDSNDIETAVYQDEKILLNKPFLNENSKNGKLFCVYAKNKKNDVVKVSFGDKEIIDKLENSTFELTKDCNHVTDKSTPGYWQCKLSHCNKNKIIDSNFKYNHQVFFDAKKKTIRSVRDGVQHYLGIELGIAPYNKVFTVYRSPEEITAINNDLVDLPIIDDHIDVDITPQGEQIIGKINTSEIIEFDDNSTDTSLYIENNITAVEKLISLKKKGKVEFSLGYTANMREHDLYDFEQYNIEPKHLALVDSARGGSILTFTDFKGKNMHIKAFLDENGELSKDKIKLIVDNLPNVLSGLDKNDFTDSIAKIVKLFDMKKMKDMDEDEEDDDKKDVKDMDENEEKIEDEDYEEMEEEKKEKLKDSILYKSLKKHFKKEINVLDSKEFKDTLEKSINEKLSIIEKAKHFLDDNYKYNNKTNKQIMIDCLKTQTTEKFNDDELAGAFKLLKQNKKYQDFGKSSTDDVWEKVANKEL